MGQSCCGLPALMMGEKEAARAVAEAGLFRTFIPTEYGGHGAGILALAFMGFGGMVAIQ